MQLTHLTEALKEIADERARIQDEKAILAEKVAQLDSSLNALAKAEAGLREVLGPPPQLELPQEPEGQELVHKPKKVYPRTVDAVYRVLSERAHVAMPAGSIVDRLQEEGLLDPELKQPYGTVLDAARRLATSKPEIVRSKRNGKVRFSFHPEKRADREPPGDARKGDLLGIPRPGGKEAPMT